MSRLEMWCIVALLAFGLVVGCWDGTHREVSFEAHERGYRGSLVVTHELYCRCRQRLYVEVYW